MKKSCILVALLFSSFVFCTKNDPAPVSQESGYTDSITVDLFSYNVYYAKHNPYYGSVTLSSKGQALVKSQDTSLLRSYGNDPFGTDFYGVIAPKFEPAEFEAFMYDSVPLIGLDSLDTNLLVTAFSSSRNEYLCPDTATLNFEKSIRPISIAYNYGYGFVLSNVPWGIGKIKIYYK